MAGLDVPGEHEDAQVRVGGSQAARDPRTVVGVIRRHADDDDRDVGLRLVDRGLERVGVAGLGDDLVPCVGEQAGEPLAEQRGVLSDHDAHGTTASTIVPRPSSLLQGRRREPARPLHHELRRLRRPACHESPLWDSRPAWSP